jgi:hypothetical protein
MKIPLTYRLSLREWRLHDDDTIGWGFYAFPNHRKEPDECHVIKCGDALPSERQSELIEKLFECGLPVIVRFTDMDVAIAFFRAFADATRVSA